VGRNPLGNQVWKKQMLAHAVDTEPATSADVPMARARRPFMVETGK